MSGYNFSLNPAKVPMINTKFRKIKTKIPVPESLSILKNLDKYESRSMHGQLPIVWDRAEDFQVFDKYGNCWIDFTSTIFLANTGHSNPEIIKALQKQLNQKLIHTYTFASEVRAKFLKKLIQITPKYLEKAFLLSAGTEATECSIKLMRMYGQTINSKKVIIISFKGNMHGRTMGAEMLKGDPNSSAWIGYKDPNILHLPFPYPWMAEEPGNDYDWARHFQGDIKSLEDEGLDYKNICGFMIESFQGWGTIFFPKSYIKELFKFAKKFNILITFDDMQGGFFRTGKLFAYQHYGVEADLICIGKALGGGLPLSAVLGRKNIMDLPEFGSMSSTHSANPLCCAAALANIEEIERKKIAKESPRKGKILQHNLKILQKKYSDFISFILGKGLMAAIFVKNPKTKRADAVLASKICEKAMQKGLLLVHTGRETIKIGPPLTISEEALVEGVQVIDECFQEIKDEITF